MYRLLYCYQNMELLNSLLFMPNEMSAIHLAGVLHRRADAHLCTPKNICPPFGRDRLAVCDKISSGRHSLAVMLLRCAASSHLHAPQWCIAGGIHLFFQ